MFSKLFWPPHSTTLRRLRYLGLRAATPPRVRHFERSDSVFALQRIQLFSIFGRSNSFFAFQQSIRLEPKIPLFAASRTKGFEVAGELADGAITFASSPPTTCCSCSQMPRCRSSPQAPTACISWNSHGRPPRSRGRAPHPRSRADNYMYMWVFGFPHCDSAAFAQGDRTRLAEVPEEVICKIVLETRRGSVRSPRMRAVRYL